MTAPASDLLVDLLMMDVSLALDGEQLKLSAPKGVIDRELRECIVANKPGLMEAIRLRERRPATPYEAPLSFAQERMWLLSQLQESVAAYTLSGALRLEGTLEVDLLQRALDEIVKRHEACRVSFPVRGGEPVQAVGPHADLRIEFHDLQGLPTASRVDAAMSLMRTEIDRPFDLEAGPLVRMLLLRVAPQVHFLMASSHHIVSDGWSMGIFIRELASIYAALRGGSAPEVPSLPISYTDFASWQRRRMQGRALEDQLTYWKRRLGGPVAALSLPTDRPRPARLSHRGAHVTMALPDAACSAIRVLAQREQATNYMAFLALFHVLLHRLSGQTDISIGTPVANRGQLATEGIIGFFANTLVIRADLSDRPGFREVLRHVRRLVLEAQENQDIPFERLVAELKPARDHSRNPFFDAMFALRHGEDARLDLPGVVASVVDLGGGTTAKFDLTLTVTDAANGFFIDLEYSNDLFDRETAEFLVERLQTLCQAVVVDPDRQIAELPVVSAREAGMLRNFASGTGPASSSVAKVAGEVLPAGASTFVAGIERQVERAGSAPAVIMDGEELSYAELDARSNRLARHLRNLGVGPGKLVALCVGRCLGMLEALIAVQKAGGAYVPLDPEFPAERLAYMLEDSGASVLITNEQARRALPSTAGLSVVDLDADHVRLSQVDSGRIVPMGQLSDPAYVIYTSGSTGKPKGVVVPNGALANFLESMAREPGFGPRDVIAAVTTISFDIAGLELYLPLMVGARIELVSREVAVDAVALGALLDRCGATVLQATPSTWRLLVESNWRPSRPLRALCGGEALPRDLADALIGMVSELWNLYGPTETTIWSSVGRVDRSPEPITVGRPIANTQIYVLDELRRPTPIGVPGEIWIGGTGVALGYHGRPDLTSERFVEDPFVARAEARMYRTGDLGRWDARGRLHVMGRLDQQVKIRGYRIELGEIEAALETHPAVKQAVVNPWQRGEGDVQLAAYVVVNTNVAPPALAGLVDHVRRQLPDYMLPSSVTFLPVIPLTPNGKVDRKALPEPKLATDRGPDGSVSAAPELDERSLSSTESLLREIWREVLNGDVRRRSSDFFNLGGHSLLAARALSRIRDRFGISMSLREFFENPTLDSQASLIDARRSASTDDRALRPLTLDIDGVPPDGPAPLSYSQERMWLIHALAPDSAAYNITGGARLRGRLDTRALEKALSGLRRRHEALRTTYRLVDGLPRQCVVDDFEQPMAVEDLREYGIAGYDRALVIGREFAARPFDLAAGPVFRTLLLRLADDDHVLLFSLHHIAGDRWSLGVISFELGVLYDSAVSGVSPALEPPRVTYRQFALWQRKHVAGEYLERQMAYWREHLSGIQPLELVPDRPRPRFQTTQGRWHLEPLSSTLIRELNELASRTGTTLFMVMTAAFLLVLHRRGGQADIAVGTPVANRNRSDVEGVVGTFVNTLVLRVSIDPGLSVLQLLQRVKDVTLEAFAHQDVPFEKLVESLSDHRDVSRAPLVQAMINMQNAPLAGLKLSGLDWEPLPMDRGAAQFELSLSIDVEISRKLVIEYNIDLFEQGTIERLAAAYVQCLQSMVSAPRKPIGQLEILSAAERALLVRGWNDTEVPEALGHTFLEFFDEQLKRSPERLAIRSEAGSLTYAELDRAAHGVARRLARLGVGSGDFVGVCLPRSHMLLAALVGVQMSGAAYVPLDPGFPPDRLGFMLADSGARALVTMADAAEGIALPPGLQLLSLDEEVEGASEEPSSGVRGPGPEDAAYALYTSGSTGKPKGVVVSHGALANFLYSMRREPGLAESDVLAAVTTISFDISGLELYLPLTVGARIELIDRDTASDGTSLADKLEACGATVLQATPASWRMLIEAGWQGSTSLKALCGGEALPRDLADTLLARVAELWNLYGPTETTIWSTLDRVTGPGEPITVGRPIANTQVFVLDAVMSPAPIGVTGEIWIGGAGVARGYLNRPELTAERFVADPFGDRPGGRLYRTGDLGRWRADGRLEHLGRADSQVKIRGYRIELGEIEAELEAHPAIRQAVVMAREAGPGDQRLAAYLVFAEGEELTATDVRRHLRRSLPDYMLPSAVIPVETIPLTPNGKVDRKALPDPFHGSVRQTEAFVEPARGTEAQLAELWQSALGIARVSAEDNFFEVGGHSLLAVRVAAAVERQFGRRLDPRSMFFQNLRQIAQSLESSPGTALRVSAN